MCARALGLALIFTIGFGDAGMAEGYGAIAVSASTQANGYSWDHGSRAQAEDVAMSNCAKHAPDCRIAVWFRNACAAVAFGERGAWGSAWAYNRGGAGERAIAECAQRSGGCRVGQTVCTSAPIAISPPSRPRGSGLGTDGRPCFLPHNLNNVLCN